MYAGTPISPIHDDGAALGTGWSFCGFLAFLPILGLCFWSGESGDGQRTLGINSVHAFVLMERCSILLVMSKLH